jgi:hypothetical protein
MTIKLSKRGYSVKDIAGVGTIFDAAYGSAGTWTTPAYQLPGYVDIAEGQLLQDGLARSSMIGTEISVLSAGPGNKAYRYPVIGSQVVLKCTRTDWRLVEVKRVTRYPGQRENISITVTSNAFQTMIKKLEGRYVVKSAGASPKVPGASNDR